jgi:hypothetical protein
VLSGVTSGRSGTNAGSYTSTASVGSYVGNYNLSFINGTLTISKALLTVTADNKSRLYGEPNPPLTTTVSGFVNSEDASTALDFSGEGSATTIALTSTGVGRATIAASVGTLTAANYDFVPVDGILTIGPLQSMLFTPPPPPKVYLKPLATPDTDPPPIKWLLSSRIESGDAASLRDSCLGKEQQTNRRCYP